MQPSGFPSRSPGHRRRTIASPKLGFAALVILAGALPSTCFAQRSPYTERDGRRIYLERCAVCHMPDGSGSSHTDNFNGFPPLTGMSEWMSLRQGQRYVAHAIIYGPYGGLTVNGKFYFGMMPRFRPRLDNGQIVAVIRYIAEHLNAPLPGYVPIDAKLVEEARRAEDTIDAVHEARYALPPR